MIGEDPYANKVSLGAMVRVAAATAIHDEVAMPEVKRINDILACDAFVDALVAKGCMITRIPTKESR